MAGFSFNDTDILNVTLGGNPAYKLDYSYTGKDNNTYKVREIGTIVNGKVYTISYFAPRESYSNYLATVQRMINSFKIIEFLPYENLDKKLRIDYPSDWTKEVTNYTNHWTFTFRSPKFLANLYLSVYPKSQKGSR